MGAKENSFIPIRLSTLRGDQKIGFDVFVRIAGKHILYCRQGDSFELTRLKRLKEKKIKQMFITEPSEPLYRDYLTKNIEIAYAADKPVAERSLIIQGLQQAATEEMIENPLDSSQYEILKQDTRKFVEFLMTESESVRSILAVQGDHGAIAHHGVNVATLATALAQKLQIENAHQIELLAVGCLLHDLEHFHSGLNVARPLKDFTQDELLTYQRHSDLGAQRTQQTAFYDSTVLKIIRSHHENLKGDGFPDGLKGHEIDPLVLIAAVADSYDRLISFEGLSPLDAFKQMMLDRVGLLPLDHIQGLGQVLKSRGVL